MAQRSVRIIKVQLYNYLLQRGYHAMFNIWHNLIDETSLVRTAKIGFIANYHPTLMTISGRISSNCGVGGILQQEMT